MIKHTQTIRRLLPTNCLSVFDHFVGLAPKGLSKGVESQLKWKQINCCQKKGYAAVQQLYHHMKIKKP